MNHHVIVRNRAISVVGPVMVQSNVAVDTVTVSVDSEYDGLQVALVIGGTQIMYDGEPVTVPSSELERAGDLPLTVLGLSSGKRVVTASAESAFRVAASGAFEGEDPVPDSPDMLQQLADAYKAANEAAGTAADAAKAAKDAVAKVDEAVSDLGDAAANAAAARESAEAAAKSASDAKVSESSARASAGSASSDASAASSSATAARQSATDAASSASAAAQSAADAKASADLAAGWVPADGEPGQLLAKTDSGTAWVDPPSGNVLVGTATGYVAHADDAYIAKPREVRVKGRTVKNLWANPSGTISGITVTENDDGSVTVEGTSTATISLHSGKRYILKPSTSYTISVDNRLSDSPTDASNGCFFFEPHSQDDSLIRGGTRYVGYGNTLSVTFTTPRELSYAYMGVFAASGKTLSGTYRVMLNEGSTAQPWCPPGLHSVQAGDLVTAGKNFMPTKEYKSQFWTRDLGDAVKVVNSLTGLKMVLKYEVTLLTADDPSLIPTSLTGAVLRSNAGVDYTSQVKFGSGFQIGMVKTVTYYFMVDEDNRIDHFYTYGCGNSNDASNMTNGTADVRILLRPATEEDNWSKGAIYTVNEPISDDEWDDAPVTTTPLPEVELRSLPNGTCDELVIGADGTCEVERRTQLVDGEVVALGTPTTEPQSPVTLPALPAPTFNAYHDSQVPSDASVEYERDVNIAYAELEAKIAALTVAQATS